MTIVKSKKIFDEICDNISGNAKEWIRNIDRLEKKVASLDAIIDSMEEADENATFQLVQQLPSSGKSGIFYIVLNASTGKYEEYEWNGASFDKVGVIEDGVYPTLMLLDVYHLIGHDEPEYDVSNPASQGWYEQDDVTGQMTVTQDTETWSSISYAEVDKTGEGYSSMNPRSTGWYELDGTDYVHSNDTTVDENKTYYTGTKQFTKDYFFLVSEYKEISSSTPGYSSMNPKKLDWYEHDDISGEYSQTLDQSPVLNKYYYRRVV